MGNRSTLQPVHFMNTNLVAGEVPAPPCSISIMKAGVCKTCGAELGRSKVLGIGNRQTLHHHENQAGSFCATHCPIHRRPEGTAA